MNDLRLWTLIFVDGSIWEVIPGHVQPSYRGMKDAVVSVAYVAEVKPPNFESETV